MTELARKVWTEQSAALGLLGSVALFVSALVAGDQLDAQRLGEIALPLLVGVGARRRP